MASFYYFGSDRLSEYTVNPNSNSSLNLRPREISVALVAMLMALLAAVACSSGEPKTLFGPRAELACDLGISADDHRGSIVSVGRAMAPTITDEQLVGVEAVESGSITRGDIILFVVKLIDTGPDGCRPGFIKRVVGLPGDEIDIRDGAMAVNGANLGSEYPFSNDEIGNQGRFFEYPVQVPENSYFVIGDSPRSSNDSRNWGYVDGNDVIGVITSVDGDEIR